MLFDSKLNADAHINDIFKKEGLKLNASARITPYMDLNKKRLLLNAFFMSQFNYCQQGRLSKKEIQPNLCNIFSSLIFNEFYLFA